MRRLQIFLGTLLLTGFIILSIFGIGGFLDINGESILSCVTKSAGMVSCDVGSNSFSSVVHEGSALDALLSIVFSSAVFYFLIAGVVEVLFLRKVVKVACICIEGTPKPRHSIETLRSWISLFELSPGV